MDSARYSIYTLLTISIMFFSITFPFIYKTNETSKSKCIVRSEVSLFHHIYQPILFYALPDLFLLSNLFTVTALCRRQSRLSSMYLNDEKKADIRICDVNSSRKQRQLTIMLVTVSLSFYLFTTPAMIFYIMKYFPPQHRELNRLKYNFLLSQISVVILQLNNAVSVNLIK